MRVDIIDKDHAKQIHDYLDHDKNYQLIWDIGISTGLRISDILRLTVKQCRQKKSRIYEQKTGKLRIIYMRQDIRTRANKIAVERGLTPNQRVFDVSRQSAWRHIKHAAERAGIDTNIGTHTMRKTYSGNYIAKGYTIQDLQQRLNHTHITDTIGYLTSNQSLGLDHTGHKKKRRKRKK